jgi:hypothetical protein
MTRPSFFLRSVALFALLAPLAGAVEFPALRTAQVTFGGGAFADTTFEDVSYVSTEFLARLFAAEPRWEPANDPELTKSVGPLSLVVQRRLPTL